MKAPDEFELDALDVQGIDEIITRHSGLGLVAEARRRRKRRQRLLTITLAVLLLLVAASFFFYSSWA